MVNPLTLPETINCMFQLAILAALWGIYTEVRKLASNKAKKD